MSLPSPFRYLDWDEENRTLIVELSSASKSNPKRWGLISVDGTPAEGIIKVAQKEEGPQKWLHNFAVMFPNYALMASKDHSMSFVVSGTASVELEDLETHEIDEFSCEATEEAYDLAVKSWTHDSDAIPDLHAAAAASAYNTSAAGATATNGNRFNAAAKEENHDEAEGDDEEEKEEDTEHEVEREHYMETRQLLDMVATLVDATNRLGVHLQLTPQQMKDAFTGAGGTLMSVDDEMAYSAAHPATGSFLQQSCASAGGPPQQCQQQ